MDSKEEIVFIHPVDLSADLPLQQSLDNSESITSAQTHAFAEGFPAWSLEPPQINVIRKRGI